jgi:hypothetical protein
MEEVIGLAESDEQALYKSEQASEGLYTRVM